MFDSKKFFRHFTKQHQLTCFWYYFKHYHQPRKVKWCSLLRCENGESLSQHEFSVLHFPKSDSVLGRKSEASEETISVTCILP